MTNKINSENEYQKALQRIAYLVQQDPEEDEREEFDALVLAVRLYNDRTYKVYTANSFRSDPLSGPQ